MYLKMCQEAGKGGGMGQLVNIGLMKFIPKDVKRHLVGGWHPFTSLNVSNKILEKALARRIRLLVT
jgi:hypothetical protein